MITPNPSASVELVTPGSPYEDRMTEADRRRIICDIAVNSTNSAIASAMDALIAATMMVHADEVDSDLRYSAWVAGFASLMSQRLSYDFGVSAVEMAISRKRPSDLAALSNLIEVVHSKTI